jgi:hypothetical protein
MGEFEKFGMRLEYDPSVCYTFVRVLFSFSIWLWHLPRCSLVGTGWRWTHRIVGLTTAHNNDNNLDTAQGEAQSSSGMAK